MDSPYYQPQSPSANNDTLQSPRMSTPPPLWIPSVTVEKYVPPALRNKETSQQRVKTFPGSRTTQQLQDDLASIISDNQHHDSDEEEEDEDEWIKKAIIFGKEHNSAVRTQISLSMQRARNAAKTSFSQSYYFEDHDSDDEEIFRLENMDEEQLERENVRYEKVGIEMNSQQPEDQKPVVIESIEFSEKQDIDTKTKRDKSISAERKKMEERTFLSTFCKALKDVKNGTNTENTYKTTTMKNLYNKQKQQMINDPDQQFRLLSIWYLLRQNKHDHYKHIVKKDFQQFIDRDKLTSPWQLFFLDEDDDKKMYNISRQIVENFFKSNRKFRRRFKKFNLKSKGDRWDYKFTSEWTNQEFRQLNDWLSKNNVFYAEKIFFSILFLDFYHKCRKSSKQNNKLTVKQKIINDQFSVSYERIKNKIGVITLDQLNLDYIKHKMIQKLYDRKVLINNDD